MRIPVPANKLVALTLIGGLLTGVVAVGLAAPGVLPNADDSSGGANTVADDAPTPNQEFTPAVQTQSGGEHEYEEHEEEEHEYEDDDHEEEEHDEEEDEYDDD